MRDARGSEAPELQADISPDVIAAYAADAASAVPGVLRLARRATGESGVVVSISADSEVEVAVHVLLATGAVGPAVGAGVRSATLAYLHSMLGLDVAHLTVVVEGAEEA